MAKEAKYWVFLRGKEDSPSMPYVSERTQRQRSMLGMEVFQYSDLPVCQLYLDELHCLGIRVVQQSKWLNAVSAIIREDEMPLLLKQSFVQSVQPVRLNHQPAWLQEKNGSATGDLEQYLDSYAINQLNGKKFQQERLTGLGVDIGVIDGRFAGANQLPGLKHFFDNHKVKAARNFVHSTDTNIYAETGNLIDYHGSGILYMSGGYNNATKIQYGLATQASFYLASTDDATREYKGEEDYWIAALEWMDSLGVRLVNSSLGYSLWFDDTKENYQPEAMDGVTSPVAKAAAIAVKEKGMTIVVSAGNEGKNVWGIVTTPGDAEGVISVGATDNRWAKTEHSSVGADFVSFLKPDFACYAPIGTSFAAPVITGMIACMLQKKPSLRPLEIAEIIKQSSHLYPYGNNYLGNGVPDAEIIMQLLNSPQYKGSHQQPITPLQNYVWLEEKLKESENIVVFHKSDKRIVVNQVSFKPEQNRFLLTRPPGVAYSTVCLRRKVTEIHWK